MRRTCTRSVKSASYISARVATRGETGAESWGGVSRSVRRTARARAGRFFFFSSRRRHTRFDCDWSSDVCSSDLGLTIPGFMVWAALVYAIAGTWLTHKIGRPLIRLNFDQQRFEADFRFNLVRFRENVEGVALYAGEADEGRTFRERFAHVVGNWWGIMRQQKRLTWFTAGYNQAAIIFPFVVAAPRFFRGEIPLGGLVQTALAFGQVQQSLSFIVNAYADIAQWRAVVNRLPGLP